jgi:hypothetical protein
MGNTSYSSADWATYSTRTSTKSTSEIFTSRGLKEDLDPKNVLVRESRDSTVNPITTPIFVNLDVTGSMGVLARQIATKGLGLIFEELLNRRPVEGPQFAFGGVGDVKYDRAPFQVSQFESDTASLTPQLEKLYLEGGGGGNDTESYNLPWWFASNKIVHDAYEKRGKRGYLFTIGDEKAPYELTREEVAFVFGGDSSVVSNSDLLLALNHQWNVFHIMVEQGSYMRSRPTEVKGSWIDLLGQRAIPLSNIDNLAEVIVSTIEVCEGTKDVDEVVKSWDGTTAMVVANAVKGLSSNSSGTNSSGIVRF